MGNHEGWVQPSGLLPNGLLPNKLGCVTRVLDMEQWSKAEQRTSELIACIQPSQPSEERRIAVAGYVQRLIMKCFSCQVFTFGSVPLKTYLPDGDIDLTAFSYNQNLKDTWAQDVRDVLEKEERSETAEFHVKEVQYIQAEVKIIKCLVENIVIDISFNQLGGLCTLCFLEEVDNLINQNHLFKRSIILIKAWCYYESRILGAHHGLISTYALETLVLYIFHVFNNSFSGPLEVLYRFLEFFSNFDWENLCVSLWGPVPISSLPEMTAEPPRRDDGELLLSKLFLDDCNLKYAVFPAGQETQGHPFVSKYFNVIDPLRTNNNLGRSVNKGNFFRIRSAFAFGAKRLAGLLECPKDSIITEVDQFFMNTWERHGSGLRPDAPSPDLYSQVPLNPVLVDGLEKGHTTMKRKGESARSAAAHKSLVDGTVASHGITPQLGSTIGHHTENVLKSSNTTSISRTHNNQNNRRISGQVRREINSCESLRPEKGQRCFLQDMVKEHEGQGRYFARTESSVELAEMHNDVCSWAKQSRVHETGKTQFSSSNFDDSCRRKNTGSEISANQRMRSSMDDPSSLRHSYSHQSLAATADSNSYHDDASGMSPTGEEFTPVTETTDMQQERDLINMMSSLRIHSSIGQVQSPLNFASAHIPVPFSPVLGYGQRNPTGMIHLVEPNCGTNIHFMQDIVSASMPRYVPTRLATSPEEISESSNETSGLAELNQEDGNVFWNEHQTVLGGEFDAVDGSFQMRESDRNHSFICSRSNSSVDSNVRGQHKLFKDNRIIAREDQYVISHYQNSEGNDYLDRNTKLGLFHGAQLSSSRTKSVSEYFCDGSSVNPSKPRRDKRGKKSAPPIASSTCRKTKTVGWQHESQLSDQVSFLTDDDNRAWIPLSSMSSTEMVDRNMHSLSATKPYAPHHQLPGYESVQISESDSMVPIAPMLVGSNTRQETGDNESVPFAAFYPTGPPVPFLTMLPVYNFPTGDPDRSSSHFDRADDSEISCINQPDENLLSESLDQAEVFSSSAGVALMAPLDQIKPDILHSDFLSHLQNLQYGRLCQSARNHGPWIYPSPVIVPPVYLQGHFPWDSPGRPVLGNMNLLTHLIGLGGPRVIPVSSIQPGSKNIVGGPQRFADNASRYRSGTGTYLPNPKVAYRDRQSSGKNHRGNFNQDKNEPGDRERGWNFASKPHSSGHSHGRILPGKLSSRLDQMTTAESHAGKPWDSYSHEPLASYHAPNGPFSFTNTISSTANVSYGMYPLPPMNSNGATSTASAVPSVMLYPYDSNVCYGSQPESLEFGSLGPIHLPGMNEASQIGDSCPLRNTYEQRRSAFSGRAARSSTDQPSSPQLRRCC